MRRPNESPLRALMVFLASLNAFLLVFNLIPAFPLDGGRIARSIAWKVTGDRAKATRFAAALGQGFAYLMIGFGVFMAVTGDVFSGVIWVFLGLFITAPPATRSRPPRCCRGSTGSASPT